MIHKQRYRRNDRRNNSSDDFKGWIHRIPFNLFQVTCKPRDVRLTILFIKASIRRRFNRMTNTVP